MVLFFEKPLFSLEINQVKGAFTEFKNKGTCDIIVCGVKQRFKNGNIKLMDAILIPSGNRTLIEVSFSGELDISEYYFRVVRNFKQY